MIENSEFIQALIASERSSKFAQDLSGRTFGVLRGKIVDVNDPENRGRVKVIFDNMSPEVQNQPEAQEYVSHWVDVSPSFVGKQSEKLINSRVVISPTEGNMGQAVIQDIIFDPATESVTEEENIPKSSTATRLPIYDAGSLPPACPENHGLMVIESGGPLNSDWLCVCLRRNGKYIWVRHVDLAHGHAGQDSGDQPPDASGDVEAPVKELSVWDYVFPSSDQEMPKMDFYGGNPKPNPYGSKAIWYEPPGGRD